MGCSICRGHAHQVCSAPGCRDETKDQDWLKRYGLVEDISTTAGGWKKLERHPIRCDLCDGAATYAHPRGGLRCDVCPKPAK